MAGFHSYLFHRKRETEIKVIRISIKSIPVFSLLAVAKPHLSILRGNVLDGATLDHPLHLTEKDIRNLTNGLTQTGIEILASGIWH